MDDLCSGFLIQQEMRLCSCRHDCGFFPRSLRLCISCRLVRHGYCLDVHAGWSRVLRCPFDHLCNWQKLARLLRSRFWHQRRRNSFESQAAAWHAVWVNLESKNANLRSMPSHTPIPANSKPVTESCNGVSDELWIEGKVWGKGQHLIPDDGQKVSVFICRIKCSHLSTILYVLVNREKIQSQSLINGVYVGEYQRPAT